MWLSSASRSPAVWFFNGTSRCMIQQHGVQVVQQQEVLMYGLAARHPDVWFSNKTCKCMVRQKDVKMIHTYVSATTDLPAKVIPPRIEEFAHLSIYFYPKQNMRQLRFLCLFNKLFCTPLNHERSPSQSLKRQGNGFQKSCRPVLVGSARE